MRYSAGLLPVHRRTDGSVLLFIGHMGGPLWARKQEHSWSVIKGEYDVTSEEPLAAALREFTEETGTDVPPGEVSDLGEFKVTSGKKLRAFTVDVPDPATVAFVGSNSFELEWPRGSGRLVEFPELDRAEWVPLEDSAELLVKGQAPIIDAVRDACFPT